MYIPNNSASYFNLQNDIHRVMRSAMSSHENHLADIKELLIEIRNLLNTMNRSTDVK